MPEKLKPKSSLELKVNMGYVEVYNVIRNLVLEYFLTSEQRKKYNADVAKKNKIFFRLQYTRIAVDEVSEYLAKSILLKSNISSNDLEVIPSVSEITKAQELLKSVAALKLKIFFSEPELVRICEDLINKTDFNNDKNGQENEYLTAKSGEKTLSVSVNKFGVMTPKSNILNFISSNATKKVKEKRTNDNSDTDIYDEENLPYWIK